MWLLKHYYIFDILKTSIFTHEVGHIRQYYNVCHKLLSVQFSKRVLAAFPLNICMVSQWTAIIAHAESQKGDFSSVPISFSQQGQGIASKMIRCTYCVCQFVLWYEWSRPIGGVQCQCLQLMRGFNRGVQLLFGSISKEHLFSAWLALSLVCVGCNMELRIIVFQYNRDITFHFVLPLVIDS